MTMTSIAIHGWPDHSNLWALALSTSLTITHCVTHAPWHTMTLNILLTKTPIGTLYTNSPFVRHCLKHVDT